MKKDIQVREVTDIGLAFIPAQKVENGLLWELFLVNLKDSPIDNVLINASGKGRGETSGKETATVRYYFPKVEAEASVLVEAILPDVLGVENTYWLSFQHEGYLYDKRYTLEPNPEKREEMWIIPLMGKLGIWLE